MKVCQRCLGTDTTMVLNSPQQPFGCVHCQRFWRALPQRKREEIAQLVLDHGHPFTRRAVNEGTPESGPWATETYGYRWGKLEVLLGGTCVYLLMEERWVDSPYGSGWDRPFYVSHDKKLFTQLAHRRLTHVRALARLYADGLQVTKHGLVRVS